MKLRNIMLISLSFVLVAAIAIGGTMAYLTSTDNDVNVMTMGNVNIEQVEYERDENGDLTRFTQEKSALPAVYDTEKWAENGVEVNGTEYKVFSDDMKNVLDKIVTVNNIGKSDAYVRTIVAIEAPDGDPNDLIHLNYNSTDVTASGNFMTKIDGVDYYVVVYTYNEVIAAGEKSAPSLMQLFLDKKTTNEDCEKYGDTWDVLVVSQAVQVDGFADATTALNTAFGVPNAVDATSGAMLCNKWFGDAIADYEVDTWDGTADISWYHDADTEFTLNSAEQLAGLAKLVDEGNSFAGKTIKLSLDMDFYLAGDDEPVSFDPIGDKSPFEGTFDGQGHTIYNIYQSGWAFGYEWGAYGSIGLFGELKGATVKNVTISGAETFVEGGDVGGITGSASGNCTFENITIENSQIATYNNGLGGIIGWSGAGEYTFKNITIASDVVLGGLWGSFDSSIGGVVGQGEPGATYNFENVDIACRIDAYNDVTASYDYYNYRMCGMIIGRLAKTTTIDGVNYPDMSQYNIICHDVTVTYDDWANYHYCRAAGARGKRVEAGYAYDGIADDYDHSVCTVHHMELMEFDQIFGGDQYGVKGIKTYDGVTVIYHNK